MVGRYQRFYAHEIINEERTEMPFKTGNADLSAKPGGNSSPFAVSLPDKIRNVKENSRIKGLSASNQAEINSTAASGNPSADILS